MSLNSITSRIGHMFKFAIFFAIRGGVILGAFALIFSGIAAFIGIAFSGISASTWSDLPIIAFIDPDESVLIVALIIALPIAVVGIVLGLFAGAFMGAVIGLVAVDYSYVILRKLDDFVFSIALFGSEDRVYSIIWWAGAVFGSFLGIILATILDIDERREVVFMILFGTFGALICSVIAISAAWKAELMRKVN